MRLSKIINNDHNDYVDVCVVRGGEGERERERKTRNNKEIIYLVSNQLSAAWIHHDEK